MSRPAGPPSHVNVTLCNSCLSQLSVTVTHRASVGCSSIFIHCSISERMLILLQLRMPTDDGSLSRVWVWRWSYANCTLTLNANGWLTDQWFIIWSLSLSCHHPAEFELVAWHHWYHSESESEYLWFLLIWVCVWGTVSLIEHKFTGTPNGVLPGWGGSVAYYMAGLCRP
jgi:hypothetical protein